MLFPIMSHHAKSDQPGDPYNASGGFLYCFLADVNHQPIARTMDQEDYARCARLMKHTGLRTNTYLRDIKGVGLLWPVAYRTVATILLNWSFWFAVFYVTGGPWTRLRIIWRGRPLGNWGCALSITRAMEREKTGGAPAWTLTEMICR